MYERNVVYAYPMNQKTSFHFIAKEHIKHMERYTRVYEADIDNINPSYWGFGHTLCLHPVMYPFISKPHVFDAFRARSYTLVGFDVCDTDKLSEKACSLISSVDYLVMPSEFSIHVYRQSCREYGIKPTPTIKVPHGVNKYFYTPKRFTNDYLKRLYEMKTEKGWKFVLFQLAHSGFRKGADLMYRAMEIVQAARDDVVLLIKTQEVKDPYLHMLTQLKHVLIDKTLPPEEYVQVFDLADVNVLCSRGGAFEHNALEGVARGIPTIVPKAGCFLEHAPYTIQVDVTNNRPVVLPGNQIHVGRGWEVDTVKLAEKIIEVIDNIDDYRVEFEQHSYYVKKHFSWHKIVRSMMRVFSKYRII